MALATSGCVRLAITTRSIGTPVWPLLPLPIAGIIARLRAVVAVLSRLRLLIRRGAESLHGISASGIFSIARRALLHSLLHPLRHSLLHSLLYGGSSLSDLLVGRSVS